MDAVEKGAILRTLDAVTEELYRATLNSPRHLDAEHYAAWLLVQLDYEKTRIAHDEPPEWLDLD